MKSFKGILAVIILGCFVLVSGCSTLEKGSGERVQLKERRIKPLAASQWNAEQERILSPLKMPDGRIFNVFSTLANHPTLMAKYDSFGLYLLRGSTLPPREREILILRIGWLCGSEYEFGQHTIVGKSVGLTDEEIRRITEGPMAPGWNPLDATLIRAVDELYYYTFITDATWNALAKRYSQQQLMDVIATVGGYNLLAMFLNSLGVQLDEGVPGFPKGKDK